MKFGPNRIRFDRPLLGVTQRLILFHPRGGSLHLQETALVIEGQFQRFRLPFYDSFIKRALCEWSTLTIPYSRIRRHRRARYLVPRTLLVILILACIAAPLFLIAETSSDVRFSDNEVGFLLAGVLVSGLLTYVLLRAFHTRHCLEYLSTDKKRYSIYFRFKSKKHWKTFVRLLDDHCEVAKKDRSKKID